MFWKLIVKLCHSAQKPEFLVVESRMQIFAICEFVVLYDVISGDWGIFQYLLPRLGVVFDIVRTSNYVTESFWSISFWKKIVLECFQCSISGLLCLSMEVDIFSLREDLNWWFLEQKVGTFRYIITFLQKSFIVNKGGFFKAVIYREGTLPVVTKIIL